MHKKSTLLPCRQGIMGKLLTILKRSQEQYSERFNLDSRHTFRCAIVVQSVFIDDAYAVGMRMKENLRFTSLNDSLNETMDEGAGDEGSRSANNDTIERISDPAGPQVVVIQSLEGNVQPILETSLFRTKLSKFLAN